MSTLGLGEDPGQPGGSAAQLAALESASAKAKAKGRAEGVSALTTESSTVTALPNGQLSLTESVLPVRVRRGRGWVPVDTSLRLSGGRLAPTAVPGSMSFSDGGERSLAVLGSPGTSVALTWPGQLPVPVVSGSEATYRNVLPGVDLAVIAKVTGFSEVLIVRNALAARNPRLVELRFGLAGQGLRVVQLHDGSLAAITRGGRQVFTAAPPLMWNSAAVAVGRTGAAVTQPAAGEKAAPVVLRSSVAGPGALARLATAGMRLTAGGLLTIVPDRAALLSPSQDFPVYIDPTWQTLPPPFASHFDMVQQTAPCNTVPYYDNENPNENEDSLGVGYFPSSWGSCYGTQNAYYTMPVPSTVDGAHINLATFNAAEDYSSSCTTSHNVNLILTGAIGTGTDYEHQPTWYTSSLDVTQNGTGVPDTAGNDINCDVTTLGPSSYSEPYGFTITPVVATAAKSPYESSITLVMTESSQDSSGDSLKRFTNNPTLTIEYDFAPAAPDDVKVGDNSSEMDVCPTSGTLPQLGASSGTGVQVTAGYSQKDAENLTAYFQYWDVTAGQADTTNPELSTVVAGSSSTKISNPVTIPQSAINKMSDNDTVDVKTWSEDPADLTSPSTTCSFKVYPTAPGGTSVTMTSAANPPMGATATFKLAAGTPKDCTASSFEWELDKPPVSGAETKVTAVSGTAPVSIVIPSPGVHTLEAYANCSNNINPTDTGSAQFTAAGDLALTCASWSAAMSNQCTNSSGQPVTSEPFDNTMLSGGDTSCSPTGGDGGGRDFVTSELEQQGWEPGGQVTVDGAQFTLPQFGSCQTDNVLAADQTIAMSGQGSALVFLTTSTTALATSTAATGTPGSIWASDATAPPVPAGVGVTGTGCTEVTQFDSVEGCIPATGKITYTNGTTATYYLSVPDWITGPTDTAAVGINDRENTAGTVQAFKPKIYAFAVPLNPSLTVASVMLPDVDDTVEATGLTYTMQALHIFGMSVRNNTSVTPTAGGTSAALLSSCDCAWTGAYESPVETAWAPTSGSWGDQTVRLAVPVNVSAPVGSQLRIHLSDPGFLWGDGDGTIDIGAATVAPQSPGGGAQAADAPQPLTFDGNPSVTLCAGCDMYSDPVTLTQWGLPAGQSLIVSLYLSNGSSSTGLPALPYLPGSASPSGATEWVSGAGTGDHTGDQLATAFLSSSAFDSLLTAVDVTTSSETEQSISAPGEPTVVIAGNNVIDQGGANTVVTPDASAPSIRIAGVLASYVPSGQTRPAGAGYGVVDAGIENNQVQADASSAGGMSLLARIDRDVLAEPDVGTVVIDEGLEDLLQDGASGDTGIGTEVTTAFGQLDTILTAYGITVVLATVTPCGGYPGSGSSPEDSCPSGGTVDNARQEVVNPWINNNVDVVPASDSVRMADFSCAVASDGPAGCSDTNPETLQATYGTGDDVNLSPAGYQQAASTIASPNLYPNVFP
jgi:hypothetical protein